MESKSPGEVRNAENREDRLTDISTRMLYHPLYISTLPLPRTLSVRDTARLTRKAHYEMPLQTAHSFVYDEHYLGIENFAPTPLRAEKWLDRLLEMNVKLGAQSNVNLRNFGWVRMAVGHRSPLRMKLSDMNQRRFGKKFDWLLMTVEGPVSGVSYEVRLLDFDRRVSTLEDSSTMPSAKRKHHENAGAASQPQSHRNSARASFVVDYREVNISFASAFGDQDRGAIGSLPFKASMVVERHRDEKRKARVDKVSPSTDNLPKCDRITTPTKSDLDSSDSIPAALVMRRSTSGMPQIRNMHSEASTSPDKSLALNSHVLTHGRNSPYSTDSTSPSKTQHSKLFGLKRSTSVNIGRYTREADSAQATTEPGTPPL